MPAHLTDYDFAAIAEEIHSDEARRQGRSMDDILTQVSLLPRHFFPYFNFFITDLFGVERKRQALRTRRESFRYSGRV